MSAFEYAALNAKGAQISADNVLIVSGSQQALDLIGKVLIDKGSKVLVETPTYLGALQAFKLSTNELCRRVLTERAYYDCQHLP